MYFSTYKKYCPLREPRVLSLYSKLKFEIWHSKYNIWDLNSYPGFRSHILMPLLCFYLSDYVRLRSITNVNCASKRTRNILTHIIDSHSLLELYSYIKINKRNRSEHKSIYFIKTNQTLFRGGIKKYWTFTKN